MACPLQFTKKRRSRSEPIWIAGCPTSVRPPSIIIKYFTNLLTYKACETVSKVGKSWYGMNHTDKYRYYKHNIIRILRRFCIQIPLCQFLLLLLSCSQYICHWREVFWSSPFPDSSIFMLSEGRNYLNNLPILTGLYSIQTMYMYYDTHYTLTDTLH